MSINDENKILHKIKNETDIIVALAGNPNVGKSSLFNSITGAGVLTANYSGKTVELNCGILRKDKRKIGFIDLPGIYYLETKSDDQLIASATLFEEKFDCIVYVIDSTNLARNLYLLLQLIELGFPLIAALNFADTAERKGLKTDIEKLKELLGIDVVQISAVRGDGIDELVRKIEGFKGEKAVRKHKYNNILEDEINILEQRLGKESSEWKYQPSKTGCAPLLLEGNNYCTSLIKDKEVHEALEEIKRELSEKYKEQDPESIIIKERYGLAGSITSQVQQTKKNKRSLSEKVWDITTYPPTGLPILLLVSVVIVLILFEGGAFLSEFIENIWNAAAAPYITGAIKAIAGEGIAAKILNWGFNDGLLAALTVGVPYVFIFYMILSFLEDTGYLNAAAFLTDKAMQFIGLNSKAFIPISAAIGCSVPAVIGTRVLNTAREKLIAITLIVLIACSARTAVIFGAVSKYIGLLWALSVILINLAIVLAAGYIMNRILKGEQEGHIVEVFPLRKPHMLTVLKKTWIRFADFIWIATPIVVAGSLILGWLYETNYIWYLTKPLAPIFEGWMGLPPVAGVALVFAILRKELALQFLIILASASHGHQISDLTSIMTLEQIYTFTVFNTIYMPCIATIAVILREVGWKWTTLILAVTLTFAIVFAGIVNKVITFLNVM